MFEWLNDNAIWLIPAAPLAAAVWVGTAGQFVRRNQAHRPVILALIVSLLAALYLWGAVLPQQFSSHDEHAEAGHEDRVSPTGVVTYEVYRWIQVGVRKASVYADAHDLGGLDARVELRADALSALMLVMVTSVSLLVAIFASGYMQGDPGYPRFFAEIALFVFSMCMLVLAGNFLLLFVFWEAVGLCSYLLIGFWFQKPSAAAAAKKAFVVNRIGDFGFILGVFLVWTTFGSIDFERVLNDPKHLASIVNSQPEIFTTICLLLFVGAVGKSAQFPLHVWLPDAMEGPTPVSALIHAATMVTAGVYLVARCSPLFVHSPFALQVVAGIGAATALIAAITALTQYDLKRVLAYSTVSQLGYMFMSLGAAGADPPRLMQAAVTFAMFHMFTHAFFKAVLFLSSGSVMHAMGDVIDMRRFSGLRKALPITHATFLCGALALAGFPLLSGFWSKDEILSVLWTASQTGERGTYYFAILVIALVTALMTAFYTFRAYFLTFHGPEVFPEEAGHHPHDAPPSMAIPLYLLAAGALVIGLATGPTHAYAHYLHHTPGLPEGTAFGLNFGMMGLSTLIGLVGIFAAYAVYGRHPGASGVQEPATPWARLSLNGLYLDEIYLAFVVRPLRGLAEVSELFDRYVIDKLVDIVGLLPPLVGAILRPVQNGLIQQYAFVMLLGLAACLMWVLQSLAG
uniref:NADH-quinone oxidoreductase subunit L n=1 Tax=Schlesneria paludicola TaxID=360056 RepID=A0A7C2NYZ3_9PLAN